jgi:hypothetical protein
MFGFQQLSEFEETQFASVIKKSNIIHLHDGVVDETISLRKKLSIKLPDAIIAASGFL